MAALPFVAAIPRPSFLTNPGNLYNAGNWLAILAALVQQFLWASADLTALLSGAAAYFFGSWPALLTTLATCTFFIGGRKYAKAWVNGFPPEAEANRAGHLWSALGALLLGIGLVGFAQNETALTLAAISTTLHAGGKLGSALVSKYDAAFKPLPLLSRLPYALSLVFDIVGQVTLPQPEAQLMTNLVMPFALIFCAALWASADCLLMPHSVWLVRLKGLIMLP